MKRVALSDIIKIQGNVKETYYHLVDQAKEEGCTF
jgi:hypothetical protein